MAGTKPGHDDGWIADLQPIPAAVSYAQVAKLKPVPVPAGVR